VRDEFVRIVQFKKETFINKRNLNNFKFNFIELERIWKMEKNYKITIKYPSNNKVLTHLSEKFSIENGMISFKYFDTKQNRLISKVVDSRLVEIEDIKND